MLYHVRTLLRTGFLVEEASRPGPRGTVEKPYRATGKSARLDNTMSSEDGAMLRAVFEAVAAEVDDAGPGLRAGKHPDGTSAPARAANRAAGSDPRPARAVPGIDDYLAAEFDPAGRPYALLLVLHKRAS